MLPKKILKDESMLWFAQRKFDKWAEENKERTVLGKRIKRLGMHQILFEKMPPE